MEATVERTTDVNQQPNLWSCYPMAASIVTGIPFGEIVQTIGHDGSRMLLVGDPPWNREAFVYGEIALAMLRHGWIVSTIPAAAANEGEPDRLRTNWPDFCSLLNWLHDRFDIVLCIQKDGRDHAVAWRRADEVPIDPNPEGMEWDWRRYPCKEIDVFYKTPLAD